MALDEVVLTARGRNAVPDTLRFLQFSPHCTLVGYHQAVEQEIRISYCREHSIETNRRLTGGGGLFWDESQLGWEIFASQDDPRFPRRIESLYELLCQGAIRGLEKLGVRAAFRPKNDIEVEGRKISGTGGTSLDGAFLFQGTLLVDFDVDTMLRALRIPIEKLKDKEIASVRERVTCLAWELDAVPPLPQIKAALAAGFAELLGVRFEPRPLTPFEEELLARRLPYFQSDEWIYGVRRPLAQRSELRALYKSPGGLIRASLVVDARRIREVFITGDFFAYPRRAILDLEARLKGTPADVEAVSRIVEEFFATEDIQIPGVTAADIVRTLREALEKTTYTQRGIAPDEVNYVFSVVKPLPEITRCTVLLLPYCAKLPDCEYRYQDGCTQCGECCIGEAYHLAEEHGLTPISIQSYEHLEETLERLKREGVEAFVGSCCEPFYAKHRDDFERIGLPGILVDVDSSTCYDLGREEEAYAGRFENQTYLKMDLLERVMARVTGRHGDTGRGRQRERGGLGINSQFAIRNSRFDVVVVGAGPGGSTAARVAAAEGLRVLVVEQRPCVGVPVQCAEYVPAQIVGYAPLPERCIAQRIRTLRTHLPDPSTGSGQGNEVVETPNAGYVLDRALFDKALAVAAGQAGAEVWTATRAVERTERGVLVRRGSQAIEVECRIIIGADGPHSTVGRWIGQVNTEFIDALQVEVVLPPNPPSPFPTREGGAPSPSPRGGGLGRGQEGWGRGRCTEVYFDPLYRGGYGWLFPKGETANVGVGVSRRMGGDPHQALAHLLERLQIRRGAIVGRTGGLVPSGGPVAHIRAGEVLLVGDAAGHTHPITGAGIFAAVVGGTLAAQSVVRAVKTGDLAALDEYEREWEPFMGGPLRHALDKRRYLDRHWSNDPTALSAVIRKTWIGFKEYGRRRRR